MQQAAAEIGKIHDGIDILINNAGIDEGIHPISELWVALFTLLLGLHLDLLHMTFQDLVYLRQRAMLEDRSKTSVRETIPH